MSEPLVSICIPTYNAARTLRETLDSLLRQTYQALEIIVSDNASVDETLRIAESYDDSRVRIVRSETNIGAEANFERCFKLGRGKYTAIFHADDIYEPQIVERQVAFLEAHEEAGAVFTGANVIDERGQRTAIAKMPPDLAHAEQPVCLNQTALARAVLRHGNFVVCPAIMARTSVYREEIRTWNGRDFATSADLDVWLRIVERHVLGFLPERLINYRRSTHHVSHQVHYLRTEPAHLFRVLEAHMNSVAWRDFLTDQDRLHYRRLWQKDLIVRACNAMVKGDRGLARTILGAAEPHEIWRSATASKREALVFATWLLIVLGLSAPALTSPLLRRVARRVG